MAQGRQDSELQERRGTLSHTKKQRPPGPFLDLVSVNSS